MKQIMKVFVGVLLLASAAVAQAYPACSGSAVGACSSITTQAACVKSYIAAGSIPCHDGQICNQSTGYCQNQPGNNPVSLQTKCIVPGIQCTWQSGSCSDMGSQCQ